MLTPDQKKRLANLERDSVRLTFERTRYTFDHSLNGIAEWGRLWAARMAVDREIEILKARDDVSTTKSFIPTVPVQAAAQRGQR